MEASQIYILISIVVLLVIAFLVIFVKKKRQERLTPLASLAFVFVLAGIVFGDNRAVGYSLIGIGVLLAIIDIVKKSKK